MKCFSLAALILAAMHAQAAPEPPTVTLEAAIQRALERSPALGAARAAVSAADARIDQASLRPQIEIGLELENFAGSGDLQGSDALETTLQLSRALELGDKRERRVDVARAGRDMALADLDAARLDVAAETARRFVELLRAQEELLAARRFLELSLAIRDEAQRRVDAGSALSAELYRARAEVGRQQLAVLSAEAGVDTAWRALAATWGEPEALRLEAAGDLFRARPLEPLPDLVARIETTPRIASLAAGERLREAERRLSEAEARPDLALTLGVRHLNEIDDAALVASVAAPLASRARSRARTAESIALLEQARATRAASLTSAVAAVGGLHRQAEVRRKALEMLGRDVVPAAAAALEQIERGYRLGRLSYGEYAIAARESVEAELQRVHVAAEYHELLIEIESLTGIAVQTGRETP
jgi:cobalt-zinc-cadmium efflux system outer membrane protein